MKIGIVVANNFATNGGGYTFENEVMKSLAKFGASEHKFVLFSWDKKQNPETLASHIQFVSIDHSLRNRLIVKLVKTASAIFKQLRHPNSKFQPENWLEEFINQNIIAHKIDLIWCLTPCFCPTLDVPYITTVWDLQHRLQPYFPEVSVGGTWDGREQIYQTILRRATVILTGTKTGKAEIEHFYQVPAETIKILPFPTPSFSLDALPDDGKQVLTRYNIPENYLFYPAQFWPHKNHVGLLLAVQLLREKYNLVFPIVFVGSEKGNQQYIKLLVTELNLITQVHFLGFVPQQDLISLYRNAFALTFLTFFGPDNLPPLEAFALGCPVVASNVSGAQEQLGDAALLVKPTDPEQIASAIKSLHDDRALYQTLIQRGLKCAFEWTGKDYIKGVLSILDEFELIRRCWSSKETYR